MAADLVITPGGPRPADQVHEVKPGNVVDRHGGHLRVLDQKGEVVADLGPVRERRTRTHRTLPHEIATPLTGTHGLGSGWITYAYWENNTGQLVSNIITTWTVPPAPTTNHGQIIYLFNGMEDANLNYIVQPVLQWSGGAWTVASWYVDGSTLVAKSPDTTVSVGQVLVGGITWTNPGTYLCGFQNIPNSALVVQSMPELTWVFQTLETYYCQAASDYPNTPDTRMKDIGVDVGNTAQPATSLSWTAENVITDIGQNTFIVNNSEVDIYYT
jgi:hypothetical protein